MCFSLGIGLHFGKKGKKKNDKQSKKRHSVLCSVDSQSVSAAQTHLGPEPQQHLTGRCVLRYTAF